MNLNTTMRYIFSVSKLPVIESNLKKFLQVDNDRCFLNAKKILRNFENVEI